MQSSWLWLQILLVINLSIFRLFLLLLILSSLSSYSSLSIREIDLFNLDISFYISQFSLLVIIVSVTILFYSSYYIRGEFNISYYLILIIRFILRIVGLLCSYNWTFLIISWEGLGISSFMLINYYQSWESYNNAIRTLITIRIGDYFLFLVLSSYLIFYYIGISTLIYNQVNYIFFVVFCLTKSAQIPFRGWLPKAIRAPTPTRALVHSSTLVTAGLLLIIVYRDFLINWVTILIILYLGFFTILLGRLLALTEYRIKKLVAYRTLSQIGIGIIVYGLGNFEVGFINLISHGFAKSLLFIQIGYLIHNSYGQQNWRKWISSVSIQGWLRIQIGCTLFSLRGIIFTSGIIRKEILLELVILNRGYFWIILFILLRIFLTILYSILIYKSLFNSRIRPLLLFSSSLFIIVGTIVEFILVILHFIWLSINSITFPKVYNYSELLVAFIIFNFIILFIWTFTNIHLLHNQISKMGYILRAGHINRWLTFLLLPIIWFETFIYIIKFSSLTIIWSYYTQSSYRNINYIHILIYLLLLLLILL